MKYILKEPMLLFLHFPHISFENKQKKSTISLLSS